MSETLENGLVEHPSIVVRDILDGMSFKEALDIADEIFKDFSDNPEPRNSDE